MDPIQQFRDQVAQNVEALSKARDLRARSLDWLRDSLPYRYSYNFTWLGRPIIQYPQDMVAMQELIWRVQPDLIIETGIAHGGSLILSASMLALLDYCDAAAAGGTIDPRASRRRVIGVDIDIRAHNRAAIEAHPLAHLVQMIEGSAIASDVIGQVQALARGHQRILVCLDSNHTQDHVLGELQAYAPLVSVGSYCVVFDTVIELLPGATYRDRPWSPGNSPMTAVRSFLSSIEEKPVMAADGSRLGFQLDEQMDSKLLISAAPGGYLRRVRSES